jgi:selenocysteine-specific elongation factor
VNRTLYFTIATAGHVDHGKTSVLRALTGIDPDRLKEEKLRQMTTDLGFAHLNLPDARAGVDFVAGFIDVPGHGKFLKNMLAGVGGIDMALLVVASDEGPMPQTVAHVKILSLLGVKKALVVLTKIDMTTAEMQSDAERRVDELLSRYGVQKLDVVKVACPSATGFAELKNRLKRLWSGWTDPSTLSMRCATASLCFS